MLDTKNKVLPQIVGVGEKMSWMARLFRILVKICLFPIKINKQQDKIKFSLSSFQFFLYNILYQGLPSFVIWIFSVAYYDMDKYYSFALDILEKTTVTDAIAMLGYTILLSIFLQTFYILLFKAQGI